MGLFEHCEVMLKEGLLNQRIFANSYRYRIMNLLANPQIVEAKMICIGMVGERS